MANWLDLAGTLESFWRVGITGPRLKDSSGNLLIRNPGDTADAAITASKLNNTGQTLDIGATNVLTLQRNAAQAAGLTVIYPAADATAGQVVAKKAGSPANTIEFEFVSAGSTAQCVSVDTTTLVFGSTTSLALFTLPANARLLVAEVNVEVVFNNTPSISIGIVGNTSKYAPSNKISLLALDSYFFYPRIAPSASPENLIVTYAAGGASAGSANILIHYAIPT